MDLKLYQKLFEDFTEINQDYSDIDTFEIDRWGYIAQAYLLASTPKDIFSLHDIAQALYLHGVCQGIILEKEQRNKAVSLNAEEVRHDEQPTH